MHDDDTSHDTASPVTVRAGSDAVAAAQDRDTPLGPGGIAAWFVHATCIPPNSIRQPSHESVRILGATEDPRAVVARSCVHLRSRLETRQAA